MTLFIDADACPVTRIAIDIAAAREIKSVLVCDVSHNMVKKGAETILVEKGADSADMKIVSLIAKGDVVVTQDYGLAALVLAKRGYALNQNGLIFTNDNIESLLEQRHFARKIRYGGGRLRGPAKRTKQNDEDFINALAEVLDLAERNDCSGGNT